MSDASSPFLRLAAAATAHPPWRRTLLPAVLLALAGCQRDTEAHLAAAAPPPALLEVRHGRLIDVYVPIETAQGAGQLCVARDVFASPASLAQITAAGSGERFVGVSPESLNPRLLLQENLDAGALARRLSQFGEQADGANRVTDGSPPVPATAALELLFDRPLAPTDAEAGQLIGQALQLRENSSELERALPSRRLVRGSRILVDPQLTASEASASGAMEAAGWPGSASAPATIELRLAASALPALGADVVRTFTCGDSSAATPGIAAAAPSAIPLRLLGHLTMYLERVDPVDSTTQQVTLFKHGLVHELDVGDTIRLLVDNTGIPVLVTELVADPVDDRERPAVSHVRALVAFHPALAANDPRRLPNYPSNPQSPAGEAWLVANAPRAVVVAEFGAERRNQAGQTYGDDPRYFVQWSPSPLANPDGSLPEACDQVSPFAGAIVRFNGSVDLNTVRPLDTLFVATRRVLDPAELQAFLQERGIDPQTFSVDKFRTPHLVAGERVALDGAQTVFRLQPPLGFYLDAAMRTADQARAFASKQFRYWLHLVQGRDGVRDRSGGELDLQFLRPSDHVAIPFALDMRRAPSGAPLYPDNHVASVCRRYAARDEDEQPSYYFDDEIRRPNGPVTPENFPVEDVFGAVIYTNTGHLLGPLPTRKRRIVDDLNQQPPPPQASMLRFCPTDVASEVQVAAATAGIAFGLPMQTPTNPFGARLQTVWREIDLSLSRVDPFDFNLDVERLYWGAHRNSTFLSDEFPQTSLYLGHAEQRPEPCFGAFSALPTFPDSGLGVGFGDGYAFNRDRRGRKEAALPHVGFEDATWVLDASLLVTEPNNVNRFAPLPPLQRPLFTWRDERSTAQGGDVRLGSDVRNPARTFEPYIISPSLQGMGRMVTLVNGQVMFDFGRWNNAQNYRLGANPLPSDPLTGGLLGAIALPLLVDLQVHPDGNASGREPIGANGWQISLAVQSSATPSFRAFSAGGGPNRVRIGPGDPTWDTASGGITATGGRTIPTDNSVAWTMIDFMASTAVATAGFVEVANPHRMPSTSFDPRLGPYLGGQPSGRRVNFAAILEPVGGRLPSGTSAVVEFRGAGEVDPQPWRAIADRTSTRPDAKNFPLDPRKAIDAHIRKDDQRVINGVVRNAWTYFYNRNVTDYTIDANDLASPAFVSRFAGPNDVFGPEQVRYVNWRIVLRSRVDGTPAVPALDSFMLTYRFELP